MSNSQEQSLNEDVVFLPVNESSPEFLYCEKERQAVERLLSEGPEAFYSSVGKERSGCFLSSEEISNITSWAQDYQIKPLHIHKKENGVYGNLKMDDFCSTYFPCHSDSPAPDLDLGWPEKCHWMPKGSATVYTSPPTEGEAPVREIIRQHIQKATKVIAIVTDRLTDGTIIGDLHSAASRGVPVYIVLNQRSIQESVTLNRLRHPNIRVRVLGGKAFCSRSGRMVVGEMNVKFLLVDLETVIHGSYSLTWTDARLHRQLITVLSGPVIESFDREFRILFAESLPVADTWKVTGSHVVESQKQKIMSDLRFQKQLSLEAEITSSPSPPTQSLLDWEAMGVVRRDPCFLDSPLDQKEEIFAKEISLRNNKLFDKNATTTDSFTNNENQFLDKNRTYENNLPVTNNIPYKSSFKNTQPLQTDLTPERMKRVEQIIEKTVSRQLSTEKPTNLDDITTMRHYDKTAGPTHNMGLLSSKTRERPWRESILEREIIMDETSSRVLDRPASRRPVILRVPQSESFSSMSDIMRRIQPQKSTSGLLKSGSRAAGSEMSQSMMDLSIHNTDTSLEETGTRVPRFKGSCLDLGHMTPAFALMKKRNDDVKSALYRTPQNLMPTDRPRSSTYALRSDWRRSLAEREGGKE